MRRRSHTNPSYVPPIPDLSLKLFRDAFPPITSPIPPLSAFTLRIPVTVSSSPRRAHLPFHYSLILPSVIREPLKRMSLIHSELTNEENVTAHFKVVRGTPCPKWHVDKVPLRGLCTLHGPGCVIMGDNQGQEIQLRAGDLVFLPGSGFDNDRKGVVHRSPSVPDTGIRVLLQTDCAKCG